MATRTLPLDSADAAAPTPVGATVARLRRGFADGRTRDLRHRQAQLRALDLMLAEQERAILDALRQDLGKGEGESLSSELIFVRGEIRHALKHLRRWAAPERVRTPVHLQPARSRIRREPLGVVLVIGAWNLPIPVLLGPAIAALAAGNAVVLKPSELAAATSALIAREVPRYLDRDTVAVVEGGAEVTATLLEQDIDKIFFTGGERVGRIVAEAAGQRVIPVTLELGGKSPAILLPDADLEVSARRLAWAKWMNAGQVCVAPDYVLAPEAKVDELVAALTRSLARFYGADPAASPDYARIVNDAHYDRLVATLAGSGGRVVHGGGADRTTRYIAPTIVVAPNLGSRLMREEIFGPILPIVPVRDAEEAVAFVNARPRPLVVHAFGRDRRALDRIERTTSSGAFLVNDATISHSVPDLPFGGVGASGYGSYHGRAGFDTFSHARAIFRRSTLFDSALRYPPYTPARIRLVRRMLGL